MTTEEQLKEVLRQLAENNKAIADLRNMSDRNRDDIQRIEAIALDDHEYVQGQRAIIRQIEEMMPDEIKPGDKNWLSPTRRLFKVRD